MFQELIYCDDSSDYNDLQKLISAEFPDARFDDASDDIHEYRFQVRGENGEQDAFAVFAIKNSFALQCLGLQLDLRIRPEKIERLIAIAKPELAARLQKG